MSLSGNLGFVSLEEVLRLLNRSKQRGGVEVQGRNTTGRIFVDRGSVSLATMLTDQQLRDHLAKSGLTTGDDPVAATSLLREMTVESIHQLGLHGESFEVIEDQPSPYPNDSPFDLEQLLVDVKQRLADWAEVSMTITDLEALVRLRRDLGDRDRITIERESWRLLSEVGHGASVRQLAQELGTTEFWAARVAAGLIEDDLLLLETVTTAADKPGPVWEEPAPTLEEPASTGAAPSTWEEVAGVSPLVAGAEAVYATADEAEVFEDPVESPAVITAEHHGAESDGAEVDPDQSWWSEPKLEGAAGEADDAEAVAASTSEEVEEDTESFLEKVFSELEPTDSDEGYGLLRRRRMGALRDFSNDA